MHDDFGFSMCNYPKIRPRSSNIRSCRSANCRKSSAAPTPHVLQIQCKARIFDFSDLCGEKSCGTSLRYPCSCTSRTVAQHVVRFAWFYFHFLGILSLFTILPSNLHIFMFTRHFRSFWVTVLVISCHTCSNFPTCHHPTHPLSCMWLMLFGAISPAHWCIQKFQSDDESGGRPRWSTAS
jgi:hypothetical protein